MELRYERFSDTSFLENKSLLSSRVSIAGWPEDACICLSGSGVPPDRLLDLLNYLKSFIKTNGITF